MEGGKCIAAFLAICIEIADEVQKPCQWEMNVGERFSEELDTVLEPGKWQTLREKCRAAVDPGLGATLQARPRNMKHEREGNFKTKSSGHIVCSIIGRYSYSIKIKELNPTLLWCIKKGKRAGERWMMEKSRKLHSTPQMSVWIQSPLQEKVWQVYC